MCLKSTPVDSDLDSMAAKLQMEEAETWRAGGCFLRDEVNLTRIGAFLIPVCNSLDLGSSETTIR